MSFAGQTVVVTGASLGVGRETARLFHAAGANVVLIARRREPLEAVARELERSMVLPLDVTDSAALVAALEAVCERFGGFHGLVNNAGAHFRGEVLSRTADELATMVDVNLRAPIILTRLALPHLCKQERAFIVNVASLAGKLPLEGAATYSASKFGLRAFTIALAQELSGTGVTVSAVNPGPIDTGFIMENLDEVADITFSQQMCTPEYVATMVLACARDGRIERDFPTGGGRLATLGYLLPAVRRMVRPMLAKKGKRVKEQLKRRRDALDGE